LKLLALLTSCLALSACAGGPTIPAAEPMPEGTATAPPAGWADYCRRNPGDVSC